MFEKFTTDSRQIKFPDYVSTRLWALIWTELLSIQSGVIKDQKNLYLFKMTLIIALCSFWSYYMG